MRANTTGLCKVCRLAPFLLVALAVAPLPAETAGWLRDGSATYPDADPPTTWSVDRNVLWKTEVGRSFASPVVIGGSVLVTAEPDIVRCVDADTGKIIWSTATPVGALPEDQQPKVLKDPGQGGQLAATPVCDGERVYVVFSTGIVAAFDLKTGARVWSQVVPSQPSTGDGRSGSPVRVADLLVVHLTELYAFDAKTGEQRWKQDKPRDAYGTPLAWRIGTDDVLFLPKGGVVRVADGKLLATIDSPLSYSSPVRAGDRVAYIDAYFGLYDLPAQIAEPLKPAAYWEDSIPGQCFTTALYHDGLLYTVTQDAKFVVLDVAAKTFSVKDLELEADVYPSPVLAGGHIFLGNSKGKTMVYAPGREPALVATNQLGEGSGATPAFSGKRIFIRSGDDLYGIGEKP